MSEKTPTLELTKLEAEKALRILEAKIEVVPNDGVINSPGSHGAIVFPVNTVTCISKWNHTA